MLVQEVHDSFIPNLPLLWAFLKNALFCVAQRRERLLVSSSCFFHMLLLRFYSIFLALHMCPCGDQMTTRRVNFLQFRGMELLRASVFAHRGLFPTLYMLMLRLILLPSTSLHHSTWGRTELKWGEDIRWERRREQKKDEGI